MATLQLVQRDSPSTVVFDFNDPTGLANPNAVTTTLSFFDTGQIERPLSLVKQVGSPLANRALGDPKVRTVTPTVNAKAADLASLEAGIGELYRILGSDSVIEHLLAWDNGSGVRYYEPLGVEGAMPSLRDQSATDQALVAVKGRDRALSVPIVCQPYPVSPERDSDLNVVVNSTLGVEGSTANRPESWGWDTNPSGESLDPVNGAYTFLLATTSSRNLSQTTPVGTAVSGTTYTDSIYLRAAAAGVVQARMVIRFADAAGSLLGSETVGTLTPIGTAYTRVSVSATAPASTSRIFVTLRFQNSAATSTQVWVRDAQAEPGSSASAFRTGYHVVNADASQPYGLVFPFVVEGTAPTPVTFDIECGTSSKLTSMRMGARWNQGTTGTNRILDYLNETRWVPGGTSAGGWTITTENLGGGTTNSDANAFGANGVNISVPDASIGVRLRRWRAVRTTNLDSLRGEWLVVGRFDPRESDVNWQLQMQYGSANIDPVPYAEEPVYLTVNRVGDTIDTGLTPYEYKALGVMRIPDQGNIGAVRIELWVARRNDPIQVGAGNLRFGGLFLMPYNPRALIEVPGVSKVTWNDEEFQTPTYKLATDAGASATFDSGDKLDGGGVRLDSINEAMGVRPTTGQAWGTGRARIEFDVSRVDKGSPVTLGGVSQTGLTVRVIRRSPSDSVVALAEVKKARKYRLEFDAVAGETYIPQAVHRGQGGRRFVISTISKTFVPYLGSGERLVSDPEQLEVTKRDASQNVQALCDVEGQTPFVLEPGRYVMAIVPGEAKQPGHENDDSPLTRTFKVRTRYSPRWTQ